jgi:thioredoxin reductase (NADPH)
MPPHDVLIIGAGPAGLATAIAARQFGLDALVLEQGTLVDAIYRFPVHMVFFTTPELLEIGSLPMTTPYEKPTRLEALRYYRRVVDTYQLQIVLHEPVVGVEHEPAGNGGGAPTFAVTSHPATGGTRVRRARAVVLAMGYYGLPNRLGIPGEDLPHVSHYYREAHPYYRRRVVIVGGKNSACEAALELHRAGALVTLVHRGAALGDSVKYWVKPDVENRIREGAIAARFGTRLTRITPTEVHVTAAPPAAGDPPAGPAAEEAMPADSVLLLTGYHADADFLRETGVDVDAATLVPRHDAGTFETNVPNLFIAGGQLAGRRTGSIFIENGRFHGEQIARVLSERLR